MSPGLCWGPDLFPFVTMTSDVRADLRDYWLTVEGRKSATVRYWLQRTEYAVRNGFDLEGYLQDPATALQEGRRWLGWKRGLEDGDHGYNNYAKLLNAIARFAGHEVKFKVLREPRSTTEDYTEQDIRRLFSFTSRLTETGRRGRALIHFALITGMRRSEALGVDADKDLDPVASTVYVRFPAKGGLRRRIPVPRELWDPTKPFGIWLRLRPIDPKRPGAIWTTSRQGSPRTMDTEGVGRTLSAISDTTGVRFNFNRARHTVATRLLRAGFRPEYVQFYLGHATFNTTRRYLHVREEDVHDAYRDLKLPRVGDNWRTR
jgi:integrase